VENGCSKEQQHLHFHDEWEIEYFFVMVKDKCCLIHNASVSLPKKMLIWNVIIMLSIAISMMLIFHPKVKLVAEQ
jgi:hypothetical protein